MNFFAELNLLTSAPMGKVTDLSSLINLALPLINIVAAFGLLFMFMLGAYTWLTAADKAENVSKAQKIFLYAIIGVILIVSSNLIVKLIGILFNVKDQIAV